MGHMLEGRRFALRGSNVFRDARRSAPLRIAARNATNGQYKSARRRFEVLFVLADEEQRKRSRSGMRTDNGVDVVHDELGAAEAFLDFAF